MIRPWFTFLPIVFFCLSFGVRFTISQGLACGSQAKGALCPGTDCCSQFGFCGSTSDFCLTSKRCQSRCINDGPPPPPAGAPAPNIDPASLFVPPANTFKDKQLVGYFSNWAQYRGLDPSTPGCDKSQVFLPENINPHLYTHINYAFVFMAANNSVIAHEFDDEDLSMRMNKWVKSINPSCTTSFSVGGWSMNDGPTRYTGGINYTPFFSSMASSASSRATFIQSCIDWARRLGFDGVDIDWEFIGDPLRGGHPEDRANFNALVSEMRAAFNSEAASSGKPPLLITVAAPAGPSDFANIDAATVSQSIDWFNLMTYDFYGNWENQVETHAPIADTITPQWSFTSAIDMYLAAGVQSNKIMAGLPLYGRVWSLDNLSQTSPGSGGTAGVAGRCTAQPGYLAYFEINEIIQAQGASPAVTFAPNDGYYLVFDNQWVGYDDTYSFAAKVQIINDRQLGGGMIWAIDLDTNDTALTKTLLSFYQTCPKDGSWPATTVGTTATLPCPVGSGKESNFQNRACNSDGTWATVENLSCISIQADTLAAKLCVQGT